MRTAGSESMGRYAWRIGVAALLRAPRTGTRRRPERKRVPSRAASRCDPKPITIPRGVVGVLVMAAVLAFAFLAIAAPGVILVASGALALAMMLSSPVRILSRFMPRPLAVAATFLGLMSSATLTLLVLAPLLSDQFRNFLGAAPAAIEDAGRKMEGLLGRLADVGLLAGTPDEVLGRAQGYVLDRLQEFAAALSGGFVSGAFDLGVGLFGVLFVAAYLLLDGRKIQAAYLRAAPARLRRDAKELWDAFGDSLSRYLGGLALVMAIQGALSGVALWALGVPYAALLGAWVGVTAIVPFVGAVIGSIPALILAFLVSPVTALATAVAFLVIQTLESNVLTPRIQGKAANVHPILVLLAVIGGGGVAGMAGVVLAVPLLAVLKVLLDFFRPRLRLRTLDGPDRAAARSPRRESRERQPEIPKREASP